MIEARHLIPAVCLLLVAAGAAPVVGDDIQQAQPNQIDSCTTITDPGEYVLSGDVRNASGGACIRIAASDVVLDGQGYELNGTGGPGDPSHVGVFVTAERAEANVTVRNLAAVGWGFGVAVSELSVGTVANVTATGNAFSGVIVQYSNGVTVRDATAANNSGSGIYLRDSADSTVTDAIGRSNAADGVHVAGGTNNSVANVTATDNDRFGVTILDAADTTASNLTAVGNALSGALLQGATNATASGVNATDNGENGLYLLEGTGLDVAGIDARDNALNGISIVNALSVTVADANASGNLGAGLRSADSEDVRVRDIAVSDSALAEVIAVGAGRMVGENVTVDGTALSFEAGDVSLDATIRPASPPEGATNVGGYLRVIPVGETPNLALTVHYDDADVSGIDEGTIGLWQYDAGWSELPDASVDVERNAVTGTLDPSRTTVVAVFGNGTAGSADG